MIEAPPLADASDCVDCSSEGDQGRDEYVGIGLIVRKMRERGRRKETD